MTSARSYVALGSALLAFALLYGDILFKLVGAWSHDENYSHGFLIVPLAAYLAWERRAKLATAAPRPSVAGLALVIAGVAALIAGVLGAEMFVSRVSILAVLAGSVLFVWGWNHLRLMMFPIAILLLMIPIPTIVFNQIAFPLQLLASRFGETALQAAHIPVLREGNVIVLANTTLEVAEACSGIRSLISLLTLAIVYGYFADSRNSIRVAIAIATVPIAVVTNGLRVAGTGIAAHYYGAAAAEGFFHEFSGWVIFLLAFALLFALMRAVAWLIPQPLQPGRTDLASERQIA